MRTKPISYRSPGAMWAMSLGGLVAGWIGLALVVSASSVDDGTLAGLLGLALAFLLASFYLVLRTARDLARYKGRSPGVWVAVTLFFGLLAAANMRLPLKRSRISPTHPRRGQRAIPRLPHGVRATVLQGTVDCLVRQRVGYSSRRASAISCQFTLLSASRNDLGVAKTMATTGTTRAAAMSTTTGMVATLRPVRLLTVSPAAPY